MGKNSIKAARDAIRLHQLLRVGAITYSEVVALKKVLHMEVDPRFGQIIRPNVCLPTLPFPLGFLGNPCNKNGL